MLKASQFWDWSLAAYQQPGVADTLLEWQEQFHLNINLYLFAAFLEQQKLPICSIDVLEQACKNWRDSHLQPMRKVRKECKPLDNALYQKAKQLELAAEKVEQSLILGAYNQAPDYIEQAPVDYIHQHYSLTQVDSPIKL